MTDTIVADTVTLHFAVDIVQCYPAGNVGKNNMQITLDKNAEK